MTLAELVVRLTGDSRHLSAALRKGKDELSGFGSHAKNVLGRLGPLAAAGAAAAAAAIAGFAIASIRSFTQVGDELAKMSVRTGFSVESLSELKHAAELSGSSLEGLETTVRRMQRSIFDAERGSAGMTDALQVMGLRVEELRGLSPEQQFTVMTEALAGVQDATIRAALAQQVFGRQGTQLLPLLAGGADGLRAMREEAHILGLVLSDEDAKASEQFNDNMERLGKVVQGAQFALARELIPQLVRFSDWAVAMAHEHGPALRQAIHDFVEGFKDFAAAVGPVVGAIANVFMTHLRTMLAQIHNFIDLVRAVFSGDWKRAWQELGDIVETALRGLRDTFKAALGVLKELATGIFRDLANAVIAIVEGMIRGILQGLEMLADRIGDFGETVLNPFLAVASRVPGSPFPSSANFDVGAGGFGSEDFNINRVAGPGGGLPFGDLRDALLGLPDALKQLRADALAAAGSLGEGGLGLDGGGGGGVAKAAKAASDWLSAWGVAIVASATGPLKLLHDAATRAGTALDAYASIMSGYLHFLGQGRGGGGGTGGILNTHTIQHGPNAGLVFAVSTDPNLIGTRDVRGVPIVDPASGNRLIAGETAYITVSIGNRSFEDAVVEAQTNAERRGEL